MSPEKILQITQAYYKVAAGLHSIASRRPIDRRLLMYSLSSVRVCVRVWLSVCV